MILRNLRFFLFLSAVLLIAGIMNAGPATAKPSSGNYIVVFERGANVDTIVPDVAQAHGLTVGHVYRHALQGMSVNVPAGRLAALERNPNVAYVVEDMVRSIETQTVPEGVQRIFADDNAGIGINGLDDYRVDVDVAVLDTGIDLDHPDLNVVRSIDCTYESGGGPPWARSAYCDVGGDDDHYHGTHVAGTIGALDNGIGVVGVAPGARLWAVKVLKADGSGTTSGIIAGIDWITANAAEIEVANMSLGGSGYSQAEYDAIQGAVNAGVAFVVAAGNDNQNAAGYSPAAFDNVLTVSALADFDGEPGGLGSPTCRTDQDDTLADFSNWGSAVDIAAPGVCVLSTYPVEQGEYASISGTSMASPHVAGAVALLASVNSPSNATDVYNLYNQVINAGNFNWTDDSGDGIKEPLLDVSNTTLFSPALVAGGGGGPTDAAPTVSISSPANGSSFNSGDLISFSGSANDSEDGDLTANLTWTSNLDGAIGSGGSFSAVLSDGNHTVTATATDSAGNTTAASVAVTVSPSGGGDEIALSVNAYKNKGLKYAELTWSGATSTNVDIYRDGSLITTTANDGLFTDGPLGKGGGTAAYEVCESGTTTCSPVVNATW